MKNPVNTARIVLFLEIFPNAKFIHIHRNPYDMFLSTRNLHRKLLFITTLQVLPKFGSDDAILDIYQKLMQQYFADRTLIPSKNLIEVRYSELEADLLTQVEARLAFAYEAREVGRAPSKI